MMALRADIANLDNGHMRMAVKIAESKEEIRTLQAQLDQARDALTKIVALEVVPEECESPKHWQAHQFHEARRIAKEAMRGGAQ